MQTPPDLQFVKNVITSRYHFRPNTGLFKTKAWLFAQTFNTSMIYIYFIRPLLSGQSDDSYVSTAKAEVVFIAATLQKEQSMLVSFNHNQKPNRNSTVFVESVAPSSTLQVLDVAACT